MENSLINEHVYVPMRWIWAVIAASASILIVLVGGIAWLTSMRSEMLSLKESDAEKGVIIRDIQTKQASSEVIQSNANLRLSNIESIMTEIQKDIKKILTAPQYRNLQ